MDYKKLAKDIENGEVDLKGLTLYVDKDYAWWGAVYDSTLSDEEVETKEEYLRTQYGRSDGKEDFYDILEAMGIPCEPC